MDRPSRTRAQTIARARNGEAKSPSELLGLLQRETNAFWRAVSINLLKRWAGEKQVTQALLPAVADQNILVRSAAIRALEPLPQSDATIQSSLSRVIEDNVRSVRIDSAWALRASLTTNSQAGKDLTAYFAHNADQPAGQLQSGIFLLDRHDIASASACFERAIKWDPGSAPPHDALAVALSMQGKTDEAARELQEACRLAPRDAELRFKLGLALNEAGKPEEALKALEATVKLDPGFSRAWYNLGLAYSGAGKPDLALESLAHAESLDEHSPQIPYARATILARIGRPDEARAAARRALEIEPGYTDAKTLLESLTK